jgi:hypothetical protein
VAGIRRTPAGDDVGTELLHRGRLTALLQLLVGGGRPRLTARAAGIYSDPSGHFGLVLGIRPVRLRALEQPLVLVTGECADRLRPRVLVADDPGPGDGSAAAGVGVETPWRVGAAAGRVRCPSCCVSSRRTAVTVLPQDIGDSSGGLGGDTSSSWQNQLKWSLPPGSWQNTPDEVLICSAAPRKPKPNPARAASHDPAGSARPAK